MLVRKRLSHHSAFKPASRPLISSSATGRANPEIEPARALKPPALYPVEWVK